MSSRTWQENRVSNQTSHMTFSLCKKWLRFFDQFAREQQASLKMNTAGEVRPATSGCFVAGTLVHTREGLVPIEKIQVGDWVLSQPEKQGERAHKCVVNTFSFEDKEIFLVRFNKMDGAKDESMVIEELAVTGNHPFWLDGQGWTRADLLGFGDCIQLHDGSQGFVICASQVLTTAEAGVGWAVAGWGVKMNDGSGNWVDLRSGAISVDFDASFNFEALEDPDRSAFKARVFNFEVEDFQTYYVGVMGAWVHM